MIDRPYWELEFEEGRSQGPSSSFDENEAEIWILPANLVQTYDEAVRTSGTKSELLLKIAIMGLEEVKSLSECIETDVLKLGDCLLVPWKSETGKVWLTPWEVLRRNGHKLTLGCRWILFDAQFDKNDSQVWAKSSLRKRLNSGRFMFQFMNKMFTSHIQDTEVWTADEKTIDKFWLLSHEEVACEQDRQSWFKANRGGLPFDKYEHVQSGHQLRALRCKPSIAADDKLSDSAHRWWLRSAYSDYVDNVGDVGSYGYVSGYRADYSDGCSPALTIANELCMKTTKWMS